MEKDNIAVVGMACTYPGAGNLNQFWSTLVNRIEVLSPGTEESTHSGSGGLDPSETTSKKDSFLMSLKAGSNTFDVPLGLAESTVSEMIADRKQALIYFVISEALRDAGISPEDPICERTDVFIAISLDPKKLFEDFFSTESITPPKTEDDLLQQIGPMKPEYGLLVKELSDRLNLGGKIESIEGDSGSAFIAMAHGISRLEQGLCSAVVIVGINAFDNNTHDSSNCNDGIESSSGRIRPFDTAADGVVMSEGAGAVILLKSGAAESRENRIYAIIKGVGISGYTNIEDDADFEGHRSAVQSAYEKSGIDSDSIGFLEGSGSGIPENDIKEIKVLRDIFGGNGTQICSRPLGAITSVIGYALAAGGMASFIKTALCLTNKIILPTLNCNNPRKELDGASIHIISELRPWIHDKALQPRRAAVNAFGIDRVNSHVILEEPPTNGGPFRAREIISAITWETELIVLSGDTKEALRQRVHRVLAYLEGVQARIDLKNLAYTLSRIFIATDALRLAIVCRNTHQLKEYLEICLARLSHDVTDIGDIPDIYFACDDNRQKGKLACLFPGLVGSDFNGPHAHTLKELSLHFPEVRKVFDLVDRRDANPSDHEPTSHLFFPPEYLPEERRKILLQRLAPPRTDLEQNGEREQRNNLPSFSVAVSNWAYWVLLRELDIQADMLMGLSVGEVSALCAADCIDFVRFIPAFWQNPLGSTYITDTGYLVLVSTDENQLKPILKQFEEVWIAFHIAPNLQIIGGEKSQMDLALKALKEMGVWSQLMPYPAVHTPRFIQMRQVVEPIVEAIPIRKAKIPVYLGANAQILPADETLIKQAIIRNADQPVMLWQAARKMYLDGARVFLQVGSANTLHNQVKSIIGKDDVIALTTDADSELSSISQLHHLCASLLMTGRTLKFDFLFKRRDCRMISDEMLVQSDVLESKTQNSAMALAGSAHHGERRSENSSPKDRGSSNPSASKDGCMPFIGRVLYHPNPEEIVVERVLDLDEDLYLKDHMFIHAPGIKPPSACLPVMPLTFSMEMMAEVAAYVAPNYGHIGFENIKAFQWIDLKDINSIPLRISARLIGENSELFTRNVHVEVFRHEAKGPAISGTVVMGKRYLSGLRLKFDQAAALRPPSVTAESIYRERFMFHGPLLQCISDITGVSDTTALGEITVLPTTGLFHSIKNPEFLTAPSLMDGVAQLCITWFLDTANRALPVGIEKIEVYKPVPPVGTRLPVYLQLKNRSHRTYAVDIEIQDGTGMVWMRIRNWRYWIFRYTKQITDFLRFPQDYPLSKPRHLPALPKGAVSQVLTEEDLCELNIDWLARGSLHLDEMATYWGLAKNPARQRRWLIARVAAKDAARLWLKRNSGNPMLHPASFSMGGDHLGEMVIQKLVGATKIPAVSVHETNGYVLAVAHTEHLNIDLKQVA